MKTKNPPTILLDEADTVFGPKAGENEDLRGLLNAGHQRNRPVGQSRAYAGAQDVGHCLMVCRPGASTSH